MPGACKAYDDGRPPRGMGSERLGEKGQQREEREYEHCKHTAVVRIHALLLYEEFRKISAEDRKHGHDGIERDYQGHAHS